MKKACLFEYLKEHLNLQKSETETKMLSNFKGA